ncbi:hypothetical protein XA68_14400 [Ophiocordyceps unilateralis]|uniref:Uncharacterized protein n=1 Tax=Ophiocordyceps unilateralis TaxID=268505 RepID=A0A2A9PLM9_OPHUN|nr:hypothetical protein XA68_14400 [Ophiocordyceps unilateralis]
MLATLLPERRRKRRARYSRFGFKFFIPPLAASLWPKFDLTFSPPRPRARQSNSPVRPPRLGRPRLYPFRGTRCSRCRRSRARRFGTLS